MSTYILADAKFFSKDENYNKRIVDNCNEILDNEDTLLLMGDISYGTETETQGVINSLKGKKKIPDFSNKKFSESFWNLLGVETYNIDGFIRGKILDKESIVYVLSSTKNLVKSLTTGYCVAAQSIPINKKLFKTRICSISTENFDYYPVDYEQLPSIVNFNEINKKEKN